MEGDFLRCEVGGHPEDTEEEERPVQAKAPPQKRREVIRVESAETQHNVSAFQLIEEESEQDMEELSFIPNAVSEPRWALHMCDNMCGEEGFKSHQYVAIVTDEGGAVRAINLRKQCFNARRLKQGERRVTASKWTEVVEQMALQGRLWALQPEGLVGARATATRRKTTSAIGGVQLAAARTFGGLPNRVLVIQDSTDHRNAKVFRAHAAPQGMWENLINAPKLLANQKKDGGSPIRMIVPGLPVRSRRKIMDGLRLFSAVDNNAAIKIGDHVVKPRFTTDFPGAVVREGADELTLRAHEGLLRTFIYTTNVGNKRWEPPPVDQDWHSFCQDMFQGVEGPEWEATYFRYKDLHQAVKNWKYGENKKGEVLRALKEAKDRGVDFHDSSQVKEIKTRGHVRLDLWAIHLENPDCRIGRSGGLEQGESVPSVASG